MTAATSTTHGSTTVSGGTTLAVEPVIRVDRVSRWFGSVVAVSDISFDHPENLGLGVANNSLLDGRLLLAADVLYEQRNVPVLLWLLPRLVAQDGEVWLADPGRPMLSRFLAGAEATGWRRAQVAAGPDTVTINRLHRAGTRRP